MTQVFLFNFANIEDDHTPEGYADSLLVKMLIPTSSPERALLWPTLRWSNLVEHLEHYGERNAWDPSGTSAAATKILQEGKTFHGHESHWIFDLAEWPFYSDRCFAQLCESAAHGFTDFRHLDASAAPLDPLTQIGRWMIERSQMLPLNASVPLEVPYIFTYVRNFVHTVASDKTFSVWHPDTDKVRIHFHQLGAESEDISHIRYTRILDAIALGMGWELKRLGDAFVYERLLYVLNIEPYHKTLSLKTLELEEAAYAQPLRQLFLDNAAEPVKVLAHDPTMSLWYFARGRPGEDIDLMGSLAMKILKSSDSDWLYALYKSTFSAALAHPLDLDFQHRWIIVQPLIQCFYSDKRDALLHEIVDAFLDKPDLMALFKSNEGMLEWLADFEYPGVEVLKMLGFENESRTALLSTLSKIVAGSFVVGGIPEIPDLNVDTVL